MSYRDKLAASGAGGGIDPITQGGFTYCGVHFTPWYPDREKLTFTMNIAIPSLNNNPFFCRAEKTPLKLQGAPLLIKIGNETCPIRINQIGCFQFNADKTEIQLLRVDSTILDNLEFITVIQEHKWFWGKN